jgi:hypothetical protein
MASSRMVCAGNRKAVRHGGRHPCDAEGPPAAIDKPEQASEEEKDLLPCKGLGSHLVRMAARQQRSTASSEESLRCILTALGTYTRCPTQSPTLAGLVAAKAAAHSGIRPNCYSFPRKSYL